MRNNRNFLFLLVQYHHVEPVIEGSAPRRGHPEEPAGGVQPQEAEGRGHRGEDCPANC